MYGIKIIGNLSTEPTSRKVTWTSEKVDLSTGEILKVPNEAMVCNFSVGANEGHGATKSTMYFRINAWRGLADICQKYLSKGRQVYIEGVPFVTTYVDRKDNQVKASVEVRAERVELLQDNKRITATENDVAIDEETFETPY